MAILDGAFPPLIGGVSQQVYTTRLPNQVASQLNMLSDPRTGPRRRPGFELKQVVGLSAGSKKLSFKADIGSTSYHVFVVPDGRVTDDHTVSTGHVHLYNPAADSWSTFTSAYLGDAIPEDLGYACLRGELFLLNRRKLPSLTTYPDYPTNLWGKNRGGFLWIKAGAFSKKYEITMMTNGTVYTSSITTGAGTTTDDYNKAAPSWIAQAFADMCNEGTATHGVTAVAFNGTVGFYRAAGTDLKIYTSAGSAYATASNYSQVSAVSDLPPKLDATMNGYTVGVGTDTNALVYYYFSESSGAWIECAELGRSSGVENMPIRLHANGSTVVLDSAVWPAALAGDANTNPYPAFTDDTGITGISSFQGRLVLLSGSYVNLSSSDNPKMFMRTTVNSLLDSDAVEVGSGSVNNASYRSAVQYNRDLVLLADGQISVMPGGSVITPKTAQIVPSNTTSLLTTIPGVQAGNMLLFPTPSTNTGTDHSGFSGLFPSQYTSSQYAVEPMTDHIPQYLPATPQFVASAGNSGFVFGNYSDDPSAIYVFQYMWKNQELALAAWHRWTLPGSVYGMHMYGDVLVALIWTGSFEYFTTLSINEANGSDLSDMCPFLDLWTARTANSTRILELPLSEYFGPQVSGSPAHTTGGVCCARATGYSGEPASSTQTVYVEAGVTYGQVQLDDSYPTSAPFYYGIPYESSMTLPKVSLRDANGTAYLQDGTYLQNLRFHLADSGEFYVKVTYLQETQSDYLYSPLLWGLPGAVPGSAKVTPVGTVEVQPFGETRFTDVTVYTSGTREMCFSGIEYTIKTERQHRRV